MWHPDNTRFLIENVRPNTASGRRPLGFWGWMHPAGPGKLVQVSPPKFKARAYLRILEDALVPSLKILYSKDETLNIVMVQNNCSIHTAKIVRECYTDHPEIVLLNWPAKSPDLNCVLAYLNFILLPIIYSTWQLLVLIFKNSPPYM